MNGKEEENKILRDQEQNSLHHETIRKRIQPQENRLLNELSVQVPAVFESDNYHLNSAYENVGLRTCVEHVGMSAVSETSGSGNYNLNSFYENVRLNNQEHRDEMSAVPEKTGIINYHIYPPDENARFHDQELPAEISAVTQTAESDNYHIYPDYENVTMDDQELHAGKTGSCATKIKQQQLHAGTCVAPKTAEIENYHIYPANESAKLDGQGLHVKMSALPKRSESDNNYKDLVYENIGLKKQELDVGILAVPETTGSINNYIYPACKNSKLDGQELHVKMSAFPKTSKSDNNHKNLVYENVGLENQEFHVGISAVPETTGSVNRYSYPAYENSRFSDQEGMSDITQTAERDNYQFKNGYKDVVLSNQFHAEVSTFSEIEESNRYYINSDYECARTQNQELHFRMPAVSETVENRKCHIIKPTYETVILGDQEFRKIDSMLSPNSRMSPDPEKNDSVERFKCHVNLTNKSALINKFTVEKNASSASQELKLNSHRKMISKSIQLPERGPKHRTKMPFGPKKNDFHERFNFHTNLAYESPVKINRTLEEDAKPYDQELNSHRAMIRKSIQLPEKGPKREPSVRMSVVTATKDFKDSGKCHINLAYESSWDLNSKVGENTSSNYQEGDRFAYREIISRSIQVPERQHRPRKLCCCSIT